MLIVDSSVKKCELLKGNDHTNVCAVVSEIAEYDVPLEQALQEVGEDDTLGKAEYVLEEIRSLHGAKK